MNFDIQHGYGKSSKISDLAQYGNLSGVILSAADEDKSALRSTATSCARLGIDVKVDPQSYVYSTSPRGRGKHHGSNGVDFSSIHWSQDAAATSSQVKAVGQLNDQLGIQGPRIAPSVIQSSFTDVWTSLSLQMARTASDAWGTETTLATIAIEESALDTWRDIDDWLDVATTLEVRGFYLLVSRANSTYPPIAWSADRMSNLLRLIYNLSSLNGYEVTWGYSDAEGILGIAAGAASMGCGWTYALRQFNPTKWQPKDSSGGAPPVVRYNVGNLWAPLRVSPELQEVLSSPRASDYFSTTELARFSAAPASGITRAEAQVQHMKVLSRRASKLVGLKIDDRLNLVESSLLDAKSNLAQIRAEGVALDPKYQSRVSALVDALASFRRSEAV